jgi:hypothetical protein
MMVSQVPCLELLHFHLYTVEGYCMSSSSLTANNTALYLQKQHSTTRGSSTSHDRALSLHHSSKNILIFIHLGSRVGILSCILQPHTGTKSPQPNSSCLPGNPLDQWINRRQSLPKYYLHWDSEQRTSTYCTY